MAMSIVQLHSLFASAGDFRRDLSSDERLHLISLADILRHELEQPEETLFRITFNEVGLGPNL